MRWPAKLCWPEAWWRENDDVKGAESGHGTVVRERDVTGRVREVRFY